MGYFEQQKKKRDQNLLEQMLKSAESAKTNASFTEDMLPVKKTSGSGGSGRIIRDVKTGDAASQKWHEGWFDKGAFSDGYQFGDISKTVLGTAADVQENAIVAVAEATEGLIDTGADLVGLIGGLFDKNFEKKTSEFVAKDLLNSQKVGEVAGNVINWTNPVGIVTNLALKNGIVKNNTEDASVLGDKSDSMVQSVTHMAGALALKAIPGAGAVLSPMAMGINAYSSEIEEAYREGATPAEARISGLISAGAELIFEQIGGIKVFKNTPIDDWVSRQLSSKISNKVVRTLAKFGIDMATEGNEEVLTEVTSRFGKKLTYMDEKSWQEMMASEEAFNSYIESFVSGAVMGGGFGAAKGAQSITTGRDYTSGMTANEQKVFDKLYSEALAEVKAENGKVTAAQKMKIYNEIESQMEKGYISTDVIEEVLGGETYTKYREAVDSEDALTKEYEELGKKESYTLADQTRYAELKDLLEKQKTDSQRNRLKEQLEYEVSESVAADRLSESYREKYRKGKAFEADLSKYNGNAKKVVQKAIDSGILNNTNRSHEFVDLVAKISADKDVDFDFTNNERLKNSGFAIEGATVNGYVSNGAVTVNVNSAKALNSVVGHEITHIFEGTELYSQLQTALFQYAEGKGELQRRRESLEKLYANVQGANIDGELTADLVGDYLFTDADFVRNLSANHQNVFQKIFDEIKYLYKVATAGSKEARELEKIKKTFEKVYREANQAQKNKNEISKELQYSLSVKHVDGTTEVVNPYNVSKEEIINFFALAKKGKLERHTYFPVAAHTPQLLIKSLQSAGIEISDKPLAMQAKKAKQSQDDGEVVMSDGTRIRYHAMPVTEILEVIEKLNDPNAIVHQTERTKTVVIDNEKVKIPAPDNFVIFVTTKSNKECVAVVEFDSFIEEKYIVEDGNGEAYHATVTVFEPDVTRKGFPFDYLEYLLEKDTNFEIDIKTEDSQTESVYHETLATDSKRESSVNNIISQTDPNVNTQNSLSADEDLLPTRDYQIRGRDVALDEPLPMRENVSTSKEAAEGSETLYTQEERSKRLEGKLQRIDKRLEREKADLKAEFENRRQSVEEYFGEDENSYFTKRARELYDELQGLKKGVRASNSLGYLIDHVNKWSDLKTALLNVEKSPSEAVNEYSEIESVVRKRLSEEYAEQPFELEAVDHEYQRRLSELEQEAAADRKAAREEEGRLTRKDVQDIKINEIEGVLQEHGYDLQTVLNGGKRLSTLSNVDNTPQRVFEKTFGYKPGQALANATINKVAQHETEAIKWQNGYTAKGGVLSQISKEYKIKPGSKESAAAQMFAEGFYTTKDGVQITYGESELAQDFPDEKVRNNIKKLATDPRIRQIYDDTLRLINESRARNGYPEIPRLENYHLHFRAQTDTFSRIGVPFNPNDIRAKDLPTDLTGVTADLKPGQPFFASAKQRKGFRTTYDLLGGLERYLSSAKNQIFHIDDIQTFRALRNYVADSYGQAKGLENLSELTEEEAQERIKQVSDAHLSNFAQFLNEEANVLAGKTSLIDRGVEGVFGRRAISVLNTINQQVGRNMVGFNISSAGTNFIPVMQTLAKSNKGAFVKALCQTSANKINSIFGRGDGFAESNPTMIRRKGVEKFYQKPYEKAVNAGYFLMGAVDDISTELIVRTKINEFLGKGMDEQTAAIEADKWASRLMGDRSYGQQPLLFNSKTLGMFTKFQLEVRNQLDAQFYDTIQEAKVSNEHIEDGLMRNAKTAAKAGSVLFQLAVLQHLFGTAYEAVAGYNPTFDIISTIMTACGYDDDEDSEDSTLDNIEQAFFELLDDLPYASVLTGGGRIPASSALPIKELVYGEDEYGNEKSRWATAAEALPYYILPGGYGQLKKTAKGLKMFDEDLPVSGSYTDSGKLRFPVEDTAVNRVQAAIFGQWASKNAQDYFDGNQNALTEEQVQEFLALDLPIQEYWDIKKGLSKLNRESDTGQATIGQKADYVAGLDLPIEKKNLLINNIADRKDPIDLTGYENYSSFEEFDYAAKNPGKYAVSQVVGGYETYQARQKALSEIESDKDENEKAIAGSRKKKVLEYLNGLDCSIYEKMILLKGQYESIDTYNSEIVEYLNRREDVTREQSEVILKELGFTVYPDGRVTW